MASTMKTPGVYISEKDQSQLLNPVGSSTGGIVIRSYKGRINMPILVTTPDEFTQNFGTPVYTSGAASGQANDLTVAADLQTVPDYGYGSYAALAFLQESSSLYCVRGWSTSDYFANVLVASNLSATSYTSANFSAASSVAPAASYSVFDKQDTIQALDNYSAPAGFGLYVYANNPSTDGNNLGITVEPFSPFSDWRYRYDAYPNDTTAASATTLTGMALSANYTIAQKVFKINVYVKGPKDAWDQFKDKTGLVGQGCPFGTVSAAASATDCYRLTPVETFYGTLDHSLDIQNNQLWIENIVNGNSKYIYVKTAASVTQFTNINSYDCLANKRDNFGALIYKNQFLTLSNGASNQQTGLGSIAGWSGFQDRETTTVGILIGTDWSSAVKVEMARIAGVRLDCIATGQVGNIRALDRTTVINAETYGYSRPSYMALYSGYSKIYDNFNDKFLAIPNSIYGAVIFARCDRMGSGTGGEAPAGTNRGILPVFDQNKIWNGVDIGELYDRNINSVKYIPGTGFVLFGQKTAQQMNTARNRINVRRLLIYIENNLTNFLTNFLFEPNSDKNRLRVTDGCNEFLKGVYAQDFLTSYNTICDSTNNTPDVIDNNELHVTIGLAPTRTVEFITLNTIITRTGVTITEG
jgi:hypothetical protein